MRLRGEDVERLSDELRAAYTPSELRQFLRTRLERSLDDISVADTYPAQSFALVEAAERGDWVPELVAAAHESRPGNAAFQEFAQRLGAGARVALATDSGQQELDASGLERVIVKSNQFLDIEEFRSRMSAIEPTVCRVEVPTTGGEVFGTGFLVAPDLVMTNYHVAEAVIPDSETSKAGVTADPAKVRLRFDFKRLPDTTVINPGEVVGLAADWLVDSSPMTIAEAKGEGSGPEPGPAQLDYAILRTAEPVGTLRIGSNAQSSDQVRGWIRLARAPQSPRKGDPMIIVQHPERAPMQIAIDTSAVLDYNDNKTRIRYRTNTLSGSSGSPCFDQHWNIVALHHFGDPNFWPWHRPGYNQGVPIPAILDLLEVRGLGADVSRSASGT